MATTPRPSHPPSPPPTPPPTTKSYHALRSDLSAALTAFDRAQDWADLIHNLQRLNRLLNKHSTDAPSNLPEKHLLAKRLAQCLASFLPSGVHLKALESYHIVFTRIGPQKLAKDLPIYAAGLFPLLSHCSTSLKSPLLSLYETHFLPLGSALSPLLDGFVLAILPGLDDETSDFFARSRDLLDSLADAVRDYHLFSRSLWRALLISPPVRLAAAHYLRAKLGGGEEHQTQQMVADIPLVAYAITAALSDTNALAQRSVLDLLLGQLALDSTFFKGHTPEHREAAVALVAGVFGALLRRDMSLTKRVHAWFLGGFSSNPAVTFCQRHSNQLILAALDAEIESSLNMERAKRKDPKAVTRVIKIAAALMDRHEISHCLGHLFALRLLRYGMLAIDKLGNHTEREVRAAVTDLLEDVGSARLFAELADMLATHQGKTREDFELLIFALSMFPARNEVVRQKHLPGLLRVAVMSLDVVNTDTVTLDKAVEFCSKAISAMNLGRKTTIDDTVKEEMLKTVETFASFFVEWLARVLEPAPVELRRAYSDVTVAEEYAAEMKMSAVCETRKECLSLAKGACAFFIAAAASKIGSVTTIAAALQATAKCASAADVRISLCGARAFADIAGHVKDAISGAGGQEQVLSVIRRCWRQMHPSLRTATPQSAQALLRLQRQFPHEMKIVVADGILSTDLSRRLRNLERFACLWRLAVEHRLIPLPSDDGLFLMLDALSDEDWGPKMLARSWLSDALEVDAASVIDAPLRLLLTPEARTVGPEHEFGAVYDAPRALYGFQVLRAILESCPAVLGTSVEHGYILSSHSAVSRKDAPRGRTGIGALASSQPTPRAAQGIATVLAVEKKPAGTKASAQSSSPEGPVMLKRMLPAQNYIIIVALTCLNYLRGKIPVEFASGRKSLGEGENGNISSKEAGDVDHSESTDDLEWILAGLGTKPLEELHAGVCAAAAECLASLLTSIPVPSQLSAIVSNLFAKPVLTLICGRMTSLDPVLELHFLNTMSFLLTSDGPYYLSSIQGKETFTKSDVGRIRISYSESQQQLQASKQGEDGTHPAQVGAVESKNTFTPWLLYGASTICGASREHDNGAQEVLGIRRRWIQFVETVIRTVGVSLPVVTEGLLVVLCESLQGQLGKIASDEYFADSEFSRVDETLVLLEGFSVVTSNVLWSFEHALAHGELNDDTTGRSSILDGSAGSRHALGASGDVSSADKGSEDRRNSSERNVSASTPSHGGADQSKHVATTTSAMMNAINPLRMINDFVKDVLTGSGSGAARKMFDPRRSSARIMFSILPEILGLIATVWGPSTDTQVMQPKALQDVATRRPSGPPRLSTDLPRERRQAQRTAVLSVVEPLFQLRPTDIIAGAISLFCEDQDHCGEMPRETNGGERSRMFSHILHGLDYATPDVVVSSVKVIFEKATKWDRSGTVVSEGRTHATLRMKARAAIRKLVSGGPNSLTEVELESIGQTSLGGNSSTIAGGTAGLDLTQPIYPSANGLTSSHQDMFHWGDFFSRYSSGTIETACLNFLEHFLQTCSDGEDVQSAWPLLQALLRDALSSCKRRGTVPAILRVLGVFIAKNPSPFPERRYRREIMVTASATIAACGVVASGTSEASAEEKISSPNIKKLLSMVALRSLASAVPKLIDSAFLEEKPQLANSVTASLSPAVSILKKAASRASSIQIAAQSSRRQRGTVVELTPTQAAETAIDTVASKAATDVILQITSRDWGVKLARRELVSLLDDTNFFYGKEDGVLEKMSAVVREIVASGSAAYLFNAIGTSSSHGGAGIPSLFSGRDSEVVVKARTIRRMSFCVFVSEPDFYSPQLPSVLEKIRDALRMGESALVVECLRCLRALLLRTGPSSISAFRATTLSELFRITANPSENRHATVAALKFLDLITLLAPPDYGFERCFFFGEPAIEYEGALKAFTPIAAKLTYLWKSETKKREEIFEQPFRLESGRTVLGGKTPFGFDDNFIGRYAAALMVRNSLPKMRANGVDTEVICKEFELEFVM